jgi:hypothetical protein
MTKGDIIKIVLGAILSATIRPLVEAYMPAKEKIRVYVKKALILLFSYLLPIGMLGYLFFSDAPLNKPFVFEVAVYFSILILNFGLAVFLKARSMSSDLEEGIIKGFEIVIEGFARIHSEHLELTKDLVKTNHQSIDKTIESLEVLKDKIKEIENKPRPK